MLLAYTKQSVVLLAYAAAGERMALLVCLTSA
jgi:hypothetical protein